MAHALERTSPKGQKFVGYCTKCGKENLSLASMPEPCPADRLDSDEAALIRAIEGTNKQ